MSDFRVSEKPEENLPRRSKHLDRKRPQIEKDAMDARERVPKPKAEDSPEKYYEYGKAKGEAYIKALDEGYGKIPSVYTENYDGTRSAAAKRLQKDKEE